MVRAQRPRGRKEKAQTVQSRISAVLAAYLKRNETTKESLVESLKVSRATAYALCNGTASPALGMDTLRSICKVTGANANYLLLGEGSEHRDQQLSEPALAVVLAEHMRRETLALVGGNAEWFRGPLAPAIDGPQLLARLTAIVREDVRGTMERLTRAAAQIAELRRVYENEPVPTVIVEMLGDFLAPPKFLAFRQETYQAFAQHILDLESTKTGKERSHD